MKKNYKVILKADGEIHEKGGFKTKREACKWGDKKLDKGGFSSAEIVEYIANPQEVLANFTSEDLLYEVHKRRDIYISGWWNSDHIQEYTGLSREYHKTFIEYCNDKAVGGELADAFEQWLESIKEELHTYLVNDWFFDIMAFGGCSKVNSESPESYRDFIGNRLEICFEPVDGIYPFIDLSYKKEDGDAEEIQNIIFDLITVFEPHQGNLKTHLEEKMQELINEYLFLDK